MTQKDTIIVGVDAGGTGCKAMAYDINGRRLAQTVTQPANIAVDTQAAITAIEYAVNLLAQQLNVSMASLAVGIGCAGYSDKDALAKVLAWSHPFAACYVTSDIHIAHLAVHGDRDAGLVIVGTGSCGALRHNGVFSQFGGHGLWLGDDSSGAWLGLHALRHTLQVQDGLATSSILSQQICVASPDIMHNLPYYRQAPSAIFAQWAPVVFSAAKQGDAVAQDLIEQGCVYLLKLIDCVSMQGQLPVCLTGGVGEAYLPYLQTRDQIQSQTALKSSVQRAEYGAMMFALSHMDSRL